MLFNLGSKYHLLVMIAEVNTKLWNVQPICWIYTNTIRYCTDFVKTIYIYKFVLTSTCCDVKVLESGRGTHSTLATIQCTLRAAVTSYATSVKVKHTYVYVLCILIFISNSYIRYCIDYTPYRRIAIE